MLIREMDMFLYKSVNRHENHYFKIKYADEGISYNNV